MKWATKLIQKIQYAGFVNDRVSKNQFLRDNRQGIYCRLNYTDEKDRLSESSQQKAIRAESL